MQKQTNETKLETEPHWLGSHRPELRHRWPLSQSRYYPGLRFSLYRSSSLFAGSGRKNITGRSWGEVMASLAHYTLPPLSATLLISISVLQAQLPRAAEAPKGYVGHLIYLV